MATRIFSPDLTVILGKLDRLASALPEEAALTTRKFAERILEDSQNLPPCVPYDYESKDPGHLKDTGHVEKIEGSRPVQWAVVYGGATSGKFVDYANEVHDDLRPRHYQRPGSGPKFVETHVERRRPEMALNAQVMLKELLIRVKL